MWTGDSRLPPCRLCFTNATAVEIERARVVTEPENEEGEILREMKAGGQPPGETIVAIAIGITRGT